MNSYDIASNFKKIIREQILIESRFSDVEKSALKTFLKQKKWSEEEVKKSVKKQQALKKVKNIVKKLSEKDPSGKNKYLSWMMKSILSLGINKKSEQRILKAVEGFHKFQSKLPKKDILAYKTLADLEQDVKEASKVKTKKQKKIEMSEDTVRVYEDEDILIIRPDTEKASCQYGKGTKWCISGKDNNQFVNYKKQGMIFYFMLHKKLKGNFSKIALTFEKLTGEINSIYLADDTEIDFENVNNTKEIEKVWKKPGLFKKLPGMIKNNLKKNPVPKPNFQKKLDQAAEHYNSMYKHSKVKFTVESDWDEDDDEDNYGEEYDLTSNITFQFSPQIKKKKGMSEIQDALEKVLTPRLELLDAGDIYDGGTFYSFDDKVIFGIDTDSGTGFMQFGSDKEIQDDFARVIKGLDDQYDEIFSDTLKVLGIKPTKSRKKIKEQLKHKIAKRLLERIQKGE